MELSQIYQPIKDELVDVEWVLKKTLKSSRYKVILKINDFLLDVGGKRLRPALVILSARASLNHQPQTIDPQLINIAAAIELIHRASLVHDDVIDHSRFRHNKPTVNSKWGGDVAIALGDYLYSVAFELISTCDNMDVLQCISSATKAMCEGELIQVCERDNLDLLKERYIVIVKKKTANLFVASCQSGAMLVNSNRFIQDALKEYGLNFGIAFQIIDDCLDLVGREEFLGKNTGADLRTGELTLPILYLLDKADTKEFREIKNLLSLCKQDKNSINELKERLTESRAVLKAQVDARCYIAKAKDQLRGLEDESPFKKNLLDLADYIVDREITK